MSKETAKYWATRLLRKTYEYKGESLTVDGWYIRPTVNGERHWIPLGTDNKANAAQRAATLYAQVKREGWASLKAVEVQAPKELTFGDLVSKAEKILTVEARTFVFYRQNLIQIVKDISGVKTTVNMSNAEYSRLTAEAYKLPLAILNRDSLELWRAAKVRAGTSPNTINCMLTCSKCIFSEAVCTSLGIENPFDKVKKEKISTASIKYKSQFDLKSLLRKIEAESQESDDKHEVYKLIILLAGSGARKGEIDKLEWRDLDLVKGRITFRGDHLKNDSSAATIPLADFAVERFRAVKPIGTYVIDGDPVIRLGKYRCSHVLGKAIKWLRAYEENGARPLAKVNKPIHTLRKEAGTVLYQQTRDIYAVKEFLRHANVKMTIDYYVDGGERIAPKIDF